MIRSPTWSTPLADPTSPRCSSTAGFCAVTERPSASIPSGSWPTAPGRRCGSSMATADRFQALPKIELHLHAAGSVRPATMREFVSTDGLSPALSETYRPAAPGEGLTAYLAWFDASDAT